MSDDTLSILKSATLRPASVPIGTAEPWQTVPLAGSGDDAAALAEERLHALELARQGRLIVNTQTTPAAIEQYRRLAAVLYQAQENRNLKTILVASTFAAEGKSLTCANIALTLSESYRRKVLLVDADLRRPTLHDTFEIPNLAGLSDWLRGEGAGKMPLVEITPNLSLLPGGRPDPDPMGGLASERMKHLLAFAAERFDWVIVDTPPVAFLPDAHLLSAMVDTVVFVVAAGQTPAPAVQRAVEEVGRDRIIGVVLNRVESVTLNRYGQSAYYARYRYALPEGSRETRD
ncbi:MAG: CpsD/CapB family tyrosine-protein kinase [Vicinamibacterales bacterium]